MNPNEPIQKRMYRDMHDRDLFAQAPEQAMGHVADVFERNVYPTEAALQELDRFDEAFPDDPTDTNDVVELLGTFRAPATVAQQADSWAIDGHKTLNSPDDSGIVLFRDREALSSALHAEGSYLVLDEARDGMFFTPAPNSSRSRRSPSHRS